MPVRPEQSNGADAPEFAGPVRPTRPPIGVRSPSASSCSIDSLPRGRRRVHSSASSGSGGFALQLPSDSESEAERLSDHGDGAERRVAPVVVDKALAEFAVSVLGETPCPIRPLCWLIASHTINPACDEIPVLALTTGMPAQEKLAVRSRFSR